MKVASPLQVSALCIYAAGAAIFATSKILGSKSNEDKKDFYTYTEYISKTLALVATTVTGIYIIC